MRHKFATFITFLVLSGFVVSLSGCTVVFQKGQRKDNQKIVYLQNEYSKLQNELSELERAKLELEDRLRNEIDDREVKVEMLDRGLVITFVAEVLFDSGKAKLRSEALNKLERVASVLKTTVADLNIGVEGHTDNVPIKYSGWKSNWELSSARAMSVLHYMVDDLGIAPVRLSATGYGEYQPVASNDSSEGRQKNRRVEIVILPKTTKQAAGQGKENLK
ncbi:MAG TPA: OmpA family protein [Candidatus Omnitrophota bacterium]|jgi:chemotaxis protein MotB|nr:OmpA family protein [Candidatus Omnitrophota bacterium]HPN55415.1 OmpA family protein [Candidatus Omnitrophota bacterium]